MNEKMHAALVRMQQMKEENCTITSEDFVRSLLPERPRNAHKGDFGRVLILAGSVGYTGAPALAANAALRMGAGLIFVGVPEPVYPIVAVKLDEPMVFPLPAKDGGLSAAAIPGILDRAARCDAVLIGPGLGRGADILPIVTALLQAEGCPLILDADGINCLEGHIDILKQARRPVVLTPHDGEFARLAGTAKAAEDRFLATRDLAAECSVTVLRKGHRTLVLGEGKAFLNTTGNPGMATGGSGDVLAGMLLALLGYGIDPTDAAAAAAWLHGAAGDDCAEALGEYGMTPGDLIAALPNLLKHLTRPRPE